MGRGARRGVSAERTEDLARAVLGAGGLEGWDQRQEEVRGDSGAAGHLDSRTVTREAGGERRFGRHCYLGCLVGVGAGVGEEKAGSGHAPLRVATPHLLHTPQPPLLVFLEFCV